jgi:hypothetical protein
MCIVVEFKGNTGHKGSIFGRQQFFAIQYDKNRDDIFYIIDRKKLLNFIDGKVEDVFVDVAMDATYKKYKRTHENKNDETTLIPVDDLINAGLIIQLYI